jgi:hypothetical protein
VIEECHLRRAKADRVRAAVDLLGVKIRTVGKSTFQADFSGTLCLTLKRIIDKIPLILE